MTTWKVPDAPKAWDCCECCPRDCYYRFCGHDYACDVHEQDCE